MNRTRTDPSPYQLDCAEINWLEDNTPVSSHYGDIYFLKQQGLAESRYVFLQQNQLQQRWQQLDTDNRGIFTIAETGFGTGLNFLASCQLWVETAPPKQHLHFISVEKHPLKREDLQRALSSWPELAPFSEALIANYPVLVPGHHTLHFPAWNISLHLLLGDASDCLEALLDSTHPTLPEDRGIKVDAWFLDGFTPAKNPALWQQKLFQLINRLSHPTTSYATFTAATAVRQQLLAQGFSVEKVPGFGRKREMMHGHYVHAASVIPSDKKAKAPSTLWAVPPKAVSCSGALANTAANNDTAVVIGAGLAGVLSAHALARRGIQVTLLERHGSIASEASGNSQGMLYTKLSPKAGRLNQFTLASYLYALRFYRQLAQQGILQEGQFDFCGLLQLSDNEAVFSTLHNAFRSHPELVNFIDSAQASDIAGISIDQAASYFPAAGWVSPPALCRQLVKHPNIELRLHHQAINLDYQQTQWQITGEDSQLLARSKVVIIANSIDAQQFQQTHALPLNSIRGQTTVIQKHRATAPLRTVLCHEGYLTPCHQGQQTLGATFDKNDTRRELRDDDHWRNLRSLYQAVPACFPRGLDTLDATTLTGRVGFRCTTPDYLPIAGAAHRHQQFLEDYAPLRKNAHSENGIAGSYYPGLYLNLGHGSRGLTSIPLCSELLAALICNEPRPLPRPLWQALSPARFVIRDLIRNKL